MDGHKKTISVRVFTLGIFIKTISEIMIKTSEFRLIYTYIQMCAYLDCVPILTYACAVKQYSSSDMSDCNLAMNNAFSKIFGFKEWQSIRVLREEFNFKSIYKIFKLAQDSFLSACRSHHNPVINLLAFVV